MVAILVAVALLHAASVAHGQPPPPVGQSGPPAHFSGSIRVGAAPAPVGAVLVAWVQGITETACARVILSEAGKYSIDIPRDLPGCGVEGATVIFRLDGRRAEPTGIFESGRSAVLNLNVSDTPPAPPAPPTPTNFALAVFGDEYPGWVYLAWNDTSQLETRFELERWQPEGGGWRVMLFTVRANIDEALDQPGAGTGQVYYRLRACRDLLCSAWTNFIGVVL